MLSSRDDPPPMHDAEEERGMKEMSKMPKEQYLIIQRWPQRVVYVPRARTGYVNMSTSIAPIQCRAFMARPMVSKNERIFAPRFPQIHTPVFASKAASMVLLHT